MPLFESESIVLKSYNLAESDRIVVFFTRDHGIVRGVAKGAKRLNSRFGSTLEPFSIVGLEYFQKDERELVSIRSVDLVRSFFEKAGDTDVFYSFSYIADLLTIFSPPHDADSTLYRMTKKCMATMAENEGSIMQMRVYFELWLLRLSGFLPVWDECLACSRTFGPNDSAQLQGSFHLLCINCAKSRGANGVSSELRRVFHSVQKLSPTDFAEFGAGHVAEVAEAADVLRRMIARVVGRDVATNSGTSHFRII